MKRGLWYGALRCAGGEDFDLHLSRVDLRRWQLHAVSTEPTTAARLAAQRAAPFAINANFFDAARHPLGLVWSDGKRIRKARNTAWQSIYLVTQDAKSWIVLPPQWKEARSVEAAVQAGPRLIVRGAFSGAREAPPAARAGVCLQRGKSHQPVFFATAGPRGLSISALAGIAARSEREGGLACQEAMLFDGGHSVNFFLEGRAAVEGDRVPVFLYAKPRP